MVSIHVPDIREVTNAKRIPIVVYIVLPLTIPKAK
jgi:hypothetical protein